MALLYSDWNLLPQQYAEQIARGRLLEAARAAIGAALPESAAIDAAATEAFGKNGFVHLDARSKGALGIGTDDRQALSDADATGEFQLTNGTYGVNSDLTLSGDMWLRGGVIRPANGITVHVNCLVHGGDYLWMDTSLGGTFDFTGNTKQKEFRVAWFGATGDGATDDAAAINRTIDACYGPVATRNGVNNAHKNRRLSFGPGRFNVGSSLNFTVLVGFHIAGNMRLGTTITVTTANTTLFNADATAYGLVENIKFATSALQDVKHALLEFDWSGTFPNTLKTQQITFRDCYFFGNGQAMVGVRIARHGGNAWDGVGANDFATNPGHFNQGTQGDTIVYFNCIWDAFTLAALAVGSREFQAAQNALSIIVHGGDFQHCTKNAIENNGGSVYVDGTSFQNQQDLSGTVAGAYAQVMNDGADLRTYTGNGALSVMRNVRSESMVLMAGAGASVIVENSQTYSGGVIIWSPNNVVQQGQLYAGRRGTAKSDGRAWIAWQGGTVGTDPNEPNWAAQPLSLIATKDAAMAQGSTTLVLPSQTYNAGAHNGKRVVVAKAGNAAGTVALFATIIGGAGSNFTLDAACQTTGGVGQGGNGVEAGGTVLVPDSVHVWIGAGLVDNGVIWLLFEFNSIESSLPVTNSQFEHGRFLPGGNAIGFTQWQLENCGFSRPDWFNYQTNNGNVGNFGRIYQQGSSAGPFTMPSYARNISVGVGSWFVPPAIGSVYGLLPGSPGEYLAEYWQSVAGAWLHKSGAGGIKYMDVGFDRVAGHDSDFRKNAVGAVGCHLSGAVANANSRGGWPVGVDQNGHDVLNSAVPGTGAGTSGWWRAATGKKGVSGSTQHVLTDGLAVDDIQRTRIMAGLVKAPSGARAALAANAHIVPDPTLYDTLRITASASPINIDDVAAAARVAGAEFTIDVLNSTGGVLVVNLGATYQFTFPAPATGKRRTQVCQWDENTNTFIPKGAQSGDF